MGAALKRLEELTQDIYRAQRFMGHLKVDGRCEIEVSAVVRTPGSMQDAWLGDSLKTALRAEIESDFQPLIRRAMRRLFGQLVEARKAAEEELAKTIDEAESAARDAGLGVNGGR